MVNKRDEAIQNKKSAATDFAARTQDLRTAYSDNSREVVSMKQDFNNTINKYNNHKDHQTIAQKGSEVVASLWNSQNRTSVIDQEVSLKTIELKRLITTRKLLVKQRTEIILSIKQYCLKEGIIIPFNSLST